MAHVYAVLADQLPEGAPALLGRARRLADVAVTHQQRPLDVALLELRDDSTLRALERLLKCRGGARRQGDVRAPDESLRAEYDRPHHDVLQLADVAGPVVRDEQLNRLRGEARRLLVEFDGIPG